jgi:MGT family glycosyltransferase
MASLPRVMRILISSLSSSGFLFPQIGLALALRERGHEIGFVTDLSFQEILEREGFRRFPRGERDGVSFQVAGWTDAVSVILQIKHIEHALELFKPDLLIGQQLTYGPLLVAARKGLPVALMGQCVYLWQSSAASEALDRFSGIEQLRVARYRGWFQFYNQMRRRYRLPPLADEEHEHLHGDLFLLRGVPEWHVDLDRFPLQVHLAGDCLWEPEEEDGELDSWLERQTAAGRPILYVQHGRAFHLKSFWSSLVGALGGSDIAVAAAVGRMDREPGKLPDNFFVRPHIPQQRVLQVARGVVSNANTTATLGALSEGLPSLVMPGGAEQPDIAERCVQLGVARALSLEAVNEDLLRAEIDHLLNDSELRRRAAEFKAAFARMPRFERAAELVESLAAQGGPVLRSA